MITNHDAAMQQSDFCFCDVYIPEPIPLFHTEMCATCGRLSMKELQRVLAESNKSHPATQEQMSK